MVNKVVDLESLILTYSPHVIVVTETWLNHDIADHEIVPPGYRMLRKDRDRRGGGVAVILRDELLVTRLADIPDLECLWVKTGLGKVTIVIGACYRPPNSDSSFFIKLNEYVTSNNLGEQNLILAGDFNTPEIDWSSAYPVPLSSQAEPLVDMAFFHNLTQLVKCETRVCGSARSTLDLVFVSNTLAQKDPVISALDAISDHKTVHLSLSIAAKTEKQSKTVYVPDFARANDVCILDELDDAFCEFSAISDSNQCNVDELWLFFKSLALRCIKDYVPKIKKMTHKKNPWMTRDIIHLVRKINRVKKSRKRQPNNGRSRNLDDLRQQLKESIEAAKQKYHSETLPNFMLTSPAKFWRYLSPRKMMISSLKVAGEHVSDKAKLANCFNLYFKSTFTIDNNTHPTFDAPTNTPPLNDLTICEDGIFSLLLDLDVKKSTGIDNVPNAFLRRYAEWCAKYLTVIFQRSLDSGKVPTEWKYAKVIPVFKAEDRELVTNYRPISLLCTAGKVLEHVLFTHICHFLESSNLLHPRQHGFRKALSTSTQLVETTHYFSEVLNRRGQVDVVFLDFSKAFDQVSHPKLLIKLKAILRNDMITNWISDYLTLRRQGVVIDGSISEPVFVDSGVPQGSVLGPLLFLIFINDILDDIPVQINLFADDCVLYTEISSPGDHLLIDASLEKINLWCAKWQMTLNAKKTVFMNITRKKNISHFSYSIDGVPLQKVESFKYLGVIITSDLRWNDHIDYISRRAFQKLGYLRRSLGRSSVSAKLTAFKTYVRPILEYAGVVWDPHTEVNKNKLEKIQRRAVRFIYSSYSWSVSPSQLLQNANLESLENRRRRDRLKFLYLIINDQLKINKNKYISFFQPRLTRRSHQLSIREFSAKNNVFHHSFFPRTVREWNSLPADVVNSPTLSSFLSQIG